MVWEEEVGSGLGIRVVGDRGQGRSVKASDFLRFSGEVGGDECLSGETGFVVSECLVGERLSEIRSDLGIGGEAGSLKATFLPSPPCWLLFVGERLLRSEGGWWEVIGLPVLESFEIREDLGTSQEIALQHFNADSITEFGTIREQNRKTCARSCE